MNGGQGAPLAPIFHKLISNIISQKYKVNFPINIINTNDEIGTLQILETETDINGEINAVFEVSAEEVTDSISLSFEATILSPEDFSVLKNTSQSVIIMTDDFYMGTGYLIMNYFCVQLLKGSTELD